MSALQLEVNAQFNETVTIQNFGGVLIGCENSFISASGERLVACLGLKNCLVVDTPEALLVADLDRSQDIREIVDKLKRNGKENLL